MKNFVQALLDERTGYIRRGLKDRVAQVDAALKQYNVEVDIDVEVAAVKPEVEQASAAKKAKRIVR